LSLDKEKVVSLEPFGSGNGWSGNFLNSRMLPPKLGYKGTFAIDLDFPDAVLHCRESGAFSACNQLTLQFFLLLAKS
jgi:hypothetical protein